MTDTLPASVSCLTFVFVFDCGLGDFADVCNETSIGGFGEVGPLDVSDWIDGPEGYRFG